MKHKRYRITIVFAFTWTVLLPFLWAYRLSLEFGLTPGLVFLAYQAELLAVLPCAVLLAGAWQQKPWAISGLWIGAFGLPLLKLILGDVSAGAWVVGAFLFIYLALRLRSLIKSDQMQRRVREGF